MGCTCAAGDSTGAVLTGSGRHYNVAIDEFTCAKVGGSADVTPEPTGFVMMAFGMIGPAGFARRRRKSGK